MGPVLGGCGDAPFHRQTAQEFRDVAFAQIPRVSLAMKENITPNPGDIGFLGSPTVMTEAHQLPDLVQEFRLVRFRRS